MDKYGYDTSREIVTEKPYRGYHIIRITSKKHYWSDISHRYLDAIDNTKVEFAFAKSDDTRPSQETNCVFGSREECKEAIDKVLDKGTIYLTKEEANKWIYTPNRKCNWSYNYKSLANVLKSYKKCDLLIIDEWLIRCLTPQESYDLLEIMETRCGQTPSRSMILCTQYEPEGWYRRINPDPESDSPISEAIMDRIIHNAYDVTVAGRISMRERHGLNSATQDCAE